jgi:hypothetical protein
MPGQGDKPMPGQGDKPMPGQGDKPMPGQGDKPMPGQGDKPMPGQGDKPMPGQGEKPGEDADPNAPPGKGQGTDPRVGPGGKEGDGAEGVSKSGSRNKADAPDAESKKAALAQIESLEDQIRKNKNKLKQNGMSDEEIAKYQQLLRDRKDQIERPKSGDDQVAPQSAGTLGSVGARQATSRPSGTGQIQGENRPDPPAEYRDAWREFSRKRKTGVIAPGSGISPPR